VHDIYQPPPGQPGLAWPRPARVVVEASWAAAFLAAALFRLWDGRSEVEQ
jgi:hypothetical protein